MLFNSFGVYFCFLCSIPFRIPLISIVFPIFLSTVPTRLCGSRYLSHLYYFLLISILFIEGPGQMKKANEYFDAKIRAGDEGLEAMGVF